MDTNWTILLCTVTIPVLSGIFLRVYPKQKLMNMTGPIAFKAGQAVSFFGNTNIGKKAMDALEEGPISTLIGVMMHDLIEFGKGLNADKVEK